MRAQFSTSCYHAVPPPPLNSTAEYLLSAACNCDLLAETCTTVTAGTGATFDIDHATASSVLLYLKYLACVNSFEDCEEGGHNVSLLP